MPCRTKPTKGKVKRRATCRNQRRDRATIISVFTITLPETFTQGRVSAFDKYLHWPHVSVNKKIYTAGG